MMQDVQLYINGLIADLEPTTVITITKQINDFGELDNRQSTFTNEFQLPMTMRNIGIARKLGFVGSTSEIFKQKCDIRLVVRGSTIIANGIGIFRKTDISKQKYSLSVYDGNKQFWQAIENVKINELDWSSYDHALTTDNFTGTFGNTEGIIYGLADFGNINLDKIEINYQTPSLFVSTIWKKIFDFAGFSYDWEPPANLVISSKRGWDSVIDDTSASWSYDSSADHNYDPTLEFQKILIDDTQPNLDDSRYYIHNNQNYHIQFSLDIQTTYAHLLSILIYREDKDGNVTILNEVLPIINSEDEFNGDYTVNYDNIVTLNDGDIVDFYAKVEYREDDQADDYEDTNPKMDISGNIIFETDTDSVAQVSISTLLGDMTLKDFVKAQLKMYAMLIDTDPVTKSCRFKSANDMLDMSNAVDWSDKFISIESEDYLLSNYGKQSWFRYNYFDKDDTFADGYMMIDNETIDDEKTVVTSPYNASEKSVTYLNGVALQYIPLWEAERDDTGAVTKWKPKVKNNVIAKVDIHNGDFDYGTTQGTTESYSGDYPVLNFSDLNWNKLITDNYQKIQKMLNWNKKVNIRVKISPKDFAKIDMMKLVYFKQLGAYFYINRIKLRSDKYDTIAEFIFVNL